MLKFYFSGAPNPTKVALFLEEAGLPYEPIPVDTRKGQQFSPEFIAINPNSKVPAIADDEAVVFDSNAAPSWHIHARLDSHHHAGLQHFVARGTQPGLFVRFQPKAVPQAMRELLCQSEFCEGCSGRRVRAARCSRPACGGAPGGVRRSAPPRGRYPSTEKPVSRRLSSSSTAFST